MGLFFYNKIGSIRSIGDLPTTNIIEPNLNQLDIIVSDVPQVCADLERILDKKSDYVDDSFAQFTIGSHCLMLSQNHLIPLEDFQSGIILHIEVEDLNQN